MENDDDNAEKKVHGEGNPEADQRYREGVREFVEDGRVEEAANDAANMTDEERRAAREAEENARKKARD